MRISNNFVTLLVFLVIALSALNGLIILGSTSHTTGQVAGFVKLIVAELPEELPIGGRPLHLEPPGEACEPEWVCLEWGVCPVEEIQTRSCIDIHNCADLEDMPELSRHCTYSIKEKPLPIMVRLPIAIQTRIVAGIKAIPVTTVRLITIIKEFIIKALKLEIESVYQMLYYKELRPTINLLERLDMFPSIFEVLHNQDLASIRRF